MTLRNYQVYLEDPGPSGFETCQVIYNHGNIDPKDAAAFIKNVPCMIAHDLSEEEARQYISILAKSQAIASIRRSDSSSKVADNRTEVEMRKKQGVDNAQKSSSCCCLTAVASVFVGFWLFGSAGELSEGGGWMVILFALIIAVTVYAVSMSSKNEKLNKSIEAKQVEREHNRSGLELVLNEAKSQDFIVSEKVSDPSENYIIAIDKAHKTFLIKCATITSYQIYPFSSLVDFEILQDSMTTLSSKTEDAVVGGLLFGAAGATAAASGKRDVDEYCSSLYLSITLDAENALRIQIPFITSKTEKSSAVYQTSLERAHEMASLLKVVQAFNLKADEQQNHSLPNSDAEKISPEIISKVKMYKSLLDDGIITEEEYEVKRKELLHL